jgi:formate dehydrogenase subunit gamma
MLLGAVSAAYRRDVGALNRFTPPDWAWLRQQVRLRRHRVDVPIGKFNAGQKLYAAFIAGAILVMLGTGVIMEYGGGLPVSYRTGATFVHDLLAYGLAAGVCGHLWMAARDPIARTGMYTGLVPAWWARREHTAWTPEPPPTVPDPPPATGPGWTGPDR